MVSVPCAMTTPSMSACRASAAAAVRMASQSAGVSWELSTDIRSTTSTSSPETRVAPLVAGRLTPSASVLLAIVPPVAMTTRRLTPSSLQNHALG
jgi:hypothetical protein